MTHPMTRGTRIVLFAAAGALALAFAGSAFSAINPRLLVGTTTQTGNSTTSIQAQVGASDDPLARLQVYLPSGVKLASPPGGVEVGSVSTTALSTQIGPGEQLAFKMTGNITAIPIADPAVVLGERELRSRHAPRRLDGARRGRWRRVDVPDLRRPDDGRRGAVRAGEARRVLQAAEPGLVRQQVRLDVADAAGAGCPVGARDLPVALALDAVHRECGDAEPGRDGRGAVDCSAAGRSADAERHAVGVADATASRSAGS